MNNQGNTDLVSNEEKCVVNLLRDKNLARVNEISAKVVPKDTFYTRYAKRCLDLLIAVPFFVVVIPFNLIFAICTFLDVGYPILYRQTRIGKNGKPFTMIKFRNMNEEKDENGLLLPPAERITRFGRFMRKYSFDELLSLWLVIKGEMSIIGPRPMPVFLYERMSERHKMRTAIRPGLECPRVIHVPGEDICIYQRTYENDVWYVENVSFGLDIRMIWRLVKMTFEFKRRGAQATGKGISYFVGYNEDGIAISMNVYKSMYKEKTET